MLTISKVEILLFKIPLVRPFVTSFAEIYDRDIVILKLTDKNNIIGYGEAPVLSLPVYNHETPDSVISILKNLIIPILLKEPLKHPVDIEDKFEFIKGNNFAKSAAVMALYDIYGKILGKSIKEILEGNKSELTISGTVSIHKEESKAVEEAASYKNKGIEYIKLKTKPGFDLKPSIAILKALPECKLMLDANSSYVLNDTTKETYKELDKLNLYCIEQPLQSFDLVDHAKLQAILRTPLALDESIESLYDMEKSLELNSCKLVNIKVARVGGITEAIKINKLCEKNNIKTWVGGMLESPIGFGVNLALATINNFDYPIDFLGAMNYMVDFENFFVEKPYYLDKGRIHIKLDMPGNSIQLNWEILNKYLKQTILC